MVLNQGNPETGESTTLANIIAPSLNELELRIEAAEADDMD